MNKNQTETNKTSALQKQLKILSEVSEHLIGHIDLPDVLRLILDNLIKQLGYTFSGVFLLDKQKRLSLKEVGVHPLINKIFKAAVGGSLHDVYYQIDDPYNKDCYVVKSVLERRIFSSSDLKDFSTPQYISSRESGYIQKLTGIKLFVCIPILLRGDAIGALIVATKRAESVENDKGVLEAFANQISVAIYNAQLFSKVQQQVTELKEQAQDLNALHELSSLAGSSLQKRRVLQALLDEVPAKLGHIGVNGAAVLLTSADQKHYIPIAITRTSFTRPILQALEKKLGALEDIKTDIYSSEILAAAFQQRVPQFFSSLSEAFPKTFPRKVETFLRKLINTRSNAIYPIISGNEVKGAVIISFSIPVEEVGKRQNEIMQVFVNHLAGALENADLFERLTEQYKTVEKQTNELALVNQRLRTLDRTKSEFISIASHQLRTPLTVIRGYLSMLQEGTIGTCDDKALMHIEKVMKSTERLITLVNDLLDISRIERGTMVFDMQSMRLEDLVRDVFSDFVNEAQKKGLAFQFVAPRSPTPPIPMDAQKLRQTILNLIDNAIKYTAKGTVQVSVKRVGNEVRLYVTDTGIGMTEEVRNNLFQKFMRGEGIAQMYTEGLGLGLYVAKQIIAYHNGRIWADSEGKGKGSTFAFALKIPSRFRK